MQCVFRILSFVVFFAPQVLAQTDSSDINAPYKLSVEEDILNLKVQKVEERGIIAASGRLEKVFETITTAYTITDEEIKQAGVNNLPEALRLIPELIVRQKSNGYFSVYIREDTYLLSGNQSNLDNSLVLVTINDVPVNDFFQGGVFWEAIPVELSDIERIEVVSTPHTVMYGTNAASGVINIVTKSVESNRLKAQANFQGGSYNTYYHRGNASFAANERLQFRFSTYYNSRDRFQDPYYIFNEGRYIPSDSLLFYNADVEKTNAYTANALQSFGLNGYAFWHVNPKIEVKAFVSTQTSTVQSVLQKVEQLALTNRNSQAKSINIRSQLYNVNVNFSYQSGTQDMAVGYPGFDLDIGKLFSSVDYQYLAKNYQLKAGTALQKSIYRNFSSPASLINNRKALPLYYDKIILGKSFNSDYGAFVTQNFYFFKRNLRIATSVRGDYLNPINHYYLSYQFGSSYKMGTKSILRAVYSKGVQSGVVQDYYYSTDDKLLQYEVNEVLNPIMLQTYEIGYRIKPFNNIYTDLNFFSTSTQHVLQSKDSSDLSGNNYNELMAWQKGATLSIGLNLNKFKLKTFITAQETSFNNQNKWERNQVTPAYYGGLSCNYSLFLNKLTINTNLYYYDHYTFSDQLNSYNMPGKTIADIKLSYNVLGEHSIYFNGKNMLNDKSVEFPYANQIKRLYLVGVDLVF